MIGKLAMWGIVLLTFLAVCLAGGCRMLTVG